MAKTLYDCIGNWFEEIILTEFNDFRRIDQKEGVVPDFTNGLFNIEAKAGFWDYGVQLKKAQVVGFRSQSKLPTIYAAGFHNMHGLVNRTKRMDESQIEKYLKENGGMRFTYLVSDKIIRRMWKKEHRTAEQNPNWHYFSMRPGHLNAIISNRKIRRKGETHNVSSFYRLKRSNLFLNSAQELGGKTKDLTFGAVLDKEEDKDAIDYFKEKGSFDTNQNY